MTLDSSITEIPPVAEQRAQVAAFTARLQEERRRADHWIEMAFRSGFLRGYSASFTPAPEMQSRMDRAWASFINYRLEEVPQEGAPE